MNEKNNSPSSRLKSATMGMLQQLLILSALVFGVSWINSYSESLLNGLIGSVPARWLFASIGTPVHELSHALVAIIFGYRITDIRLFIPDPNSSVLGYVSYSYNSGNFLQQIGHFFVGIAPVFLPLLFLYLLYRFLLPRNLVQNGKVRWRGLFHIRTILFLYLSAQIILHMRCSPADLQNALYGLPLLILLLFLIGLISPKAQRYLLTNSLKMTILAFTFAVIDFLLIRGAVFIFN